MDEEILLKRRLIDTANKAYRQNIYTYTNFLSMSELDTYYRTLPELSSVSYTHLTILYKYELVCIGTLKLREEIRACLYTHTKTGCF